jgi:TolB-like protein
VTPADPFASLESALRDRYRIDRLLGHGGMAVVYLAHDLRHDRPVALKVMRPELAAGLGAERFLREIRVTARLQHAHILPLLDSGVVESETGIPSPFYVMPYVEGESLRNRLSRERQLSLEESLRLAGDVTAALAYAHGHGVIHRDIKPENILLSGTAPTLEAIVVDFGIARALSLAGSDRLTETGLALGTPHYMSPEQAAGDTGVDARTDVYATGCVLYEMLAGDPPFTGPTTQAVVARALTESPPSIRTTRPNVPEDVDRIITRALAKVPADRFSTAAEMHDAIARATAAPAVASPASRARPRKPLAVLAVFAVFAALAVLAIVRSRRDAPAIIAPASSIAVLPFTPSVTDTALSRLGRDLVFTLTAELDGLGGIRTADAHTVLARTRNESLAGIGDYVSLGRSLGAGSIVQGSLVRVGPDVRLDLALVGTDSAPAPLARATVTAPQDSVAALTDSAARGLLVQIWSRGTPPTPSLDAALRTRSVPALRAFLEGERELSHGEWENAATSYKRAMEADPRFWLAYARHVYAGYWSLHEPAESVFVVVDRHRAELPERERLSTEAMLLQARDSVGLALERSALVTQRYPDFWFGWLFHGDVLFHSGPILGHTLAESGRAFARARELNPDLIPAWEHSTPVAVLEGDTAAVTLSIEALKRLDAGPVLSADGYGDRLILFPFLRAIMRGDRAQVAMLSDSVARDPAPAAATTGSFFDGFNFGFFPEQIDVSRRIVEAGGGPPERLRFHRQTIALSWAGRGAWDSALAGLDKLAAEGADSTDALRAYGIAALGAWLEAIDPREAAARRSLAAESGRGAGGRAELAWIDGVVASARRDRAALTQARTRLNQSGDPASRALDRSLGALDAALRGDTAEAGAALAALEWEEAAVLAPDFVDHPLVIALDRIAGARWLSAAGDAEQALRLLRWSEGVFLLHPSTAYSPAFAGLVDLERGRIEDRLGRAEPARASYTRFLQLYDRPMARQRSMVEEVKKRVTAMRPTP